MTKNSDEAARLIKMLQPVPTIMARAVGKAVYSAVLHHTHRDSGEATFNWRADINTTQVRPFVPMRGRYPVGSTGDRQRGVDNIQVIDDRFANFTGRLVGKDIKTIHVYNETPQEDGHASNARLDRARAVADNPGWLEGIAEGALRNAKL